MKGLALFFESETGQRVKNAIIGVGAAIVMIGALFKLESFPGAGIFLILGLSIEAFIFFLQGILPPHSNYYWEKAYPGLNIHPHLDDNYEEPRPGAKRGPSVTHQLDDMLESANVETKLIERLGANLGKLGDNVAKMSEIGEASIATNEYAAKTKEAISALNEMKNAYASATGSIQALSNSTAQFQQYHEQILEVSSKLAALNSVYEVELKETTSGLKSLNKNLAGLNSVYGNMLSAMTMPRG
ncbi:MAG: gliding motility protein GldL [Chitinophagales bacterium]|nr:gliding motility protein GldL [Chitinophagales bacterium]